MTDPLTEAMRRHRAALHEVGTAREHLQQAQAEVRRTRVEVHAAIVAAARGGVRQVDIVNITGLGREQIRRICRAAGVEPDN